MSISWFVLDNSNSQYSTVVAALETATANKYDGSVNQNIRGFITNTKKIIKANITESERTGDLAVLSRNKRGVGIYKDEIIDATDKRLKLFDMLGESGRTFKYIRQEISGGYNDWDGSSYGDAFNGPLDANINGGVNSVHQDGNTYSYCGEIYGVWNSFGPEGKFGKGEIELGKSNTTGNINAIILRCDDALDPGLVYDNCRRRTNGQILPWEEYSTNVYVQGDFNFIDDLLEFGNPSYAVITGQNTFSNISTIIQQAVLERANNISNLQSQAEMFWIMNSGDAARNNVVQVWQYDDSLTSYSDQTANANSSSTLDWNFYPTSPAVGDVIYVSYNNIFSGLEIDVGTPGVGTYTIQWEYWNGAWTTLSNIQDYTNNLKYAGANVIAFNPKSDWVTTIINGSSNSYYVRGVLQSGTITTPPVGDQSWIRQMAMFVRLHDNSNPTGRQVLVPSAGLYWSTNSTNSNNRCGQVEFINMSIFNSGSVPDALTPGNSRPGVEGDLPYIWLFKGGRYFYSSASWLQYGGMTELSFVESTDGRIPWNTDDLPSNTSEGIQTLINPRANNITASDPTKFLNMNRWVILDHQINGLYFNSTGSAFTGDRPEQCNINGMMILNTGTFNKGLDNQSGQPDMHALACRGRKPDTPWVWDKIYIKKAGSAINLYQSGTGEGQAPINGAALNFKNFSLSDFVIEGNNGAENSAGQNGISPNGDNDLILMDDGSGNHSNVSFERGAFLDIVPTVGTFESVYTNPVVTSAGEAIAMNWDQLHTIKDMQIIRCAHGFRGDRSGHIQALDIIQEDNANATFTDITNSVINDGTLSSVLLFNSNPSANYAVYIGRKVDSFRAPSVNVTVAASGTYTLAFEYWNGSLWTGLANVTDGTANLTTLSENHIIFDRPLDWSNNTVGTKDRYWMRVRLATGSFTTEPQVDLIRGPDTGYYFNASNIYLEDIVHYWMATRSGTYSGGTHTLLLNDFKGKLLAGQTIAANNLFRFGSNGGEETLATFKNREKNRILTDAYANSVFLSNVSTTPGIDIIEV